MLESDDAARDRVTGGDDRANLRRKRGGRRHLERGRAREALCPDAAEAEKARRSKGTVIHPARPAGDLAREDRREDEREAPVEPGREHGKRRDERDRPARRIRPSREPGDEPLHRSRRRDDESGDDDQRHLHRERKKLPETVAPGAGQIECGRADREPRDEHEQRRSEREDEGVGDPALGEAREAARDAFEPSVHVRFLARLAFGSAEARAVVRRSRKQPDDP